MPIYKIRRTEEVTFSKVFEVEADTKEEALKEVEENEDKVYEIEDNNENYDGTYYESEIEE